MTVLTRWEPFRELATLQERMNRLFTDQFGQVADENMAAAAFMPPVDVYEDENTLQLKLEVPGVEEKDIDIRIENNMLTVRGERKFEKEEKEQNFHRIERRYGTFSRSFQLPPSVNTEDVKADYVNGVLKISMAKRAEAKPKQIKVGIGGKEDIAYNNCQIMRSKFDEMKIPYVYDDYPGGHAWPVWRHDLYEFAPLLFR